MADDATTETEFGVKYPDGRINWAVEQWYGTATISTPASRKDFQERYSMQLASLGMPAATLTFLQREKTITYAEATEIEDPAPETATDPQEGPSNDGSSA